MRHTSTESTYNNNATLEQVADRLRSANRIALLTHSKPDGDALGSTLALARTLERLGKPATAAYFGPWTHAFDHLVDATSVLHESAGCWERPPLSKADTIVLMDTGSWSQVAEARRFLEERAAATIVIDHHAAGDADIAELRLIDTAAAAACEIAAGLCCKLLDKATPAALPVDIARALYVGIATDTGWFRHSNTTAHTHRLAAELMQAGVQPAELFELLFQSDSIARLRLLQRALASVQLLAAGRTAMMVLTRQDYQEAGATLDEGAGFSDVVLGVESVRAVVTITEMADDLTKLSFRSKAGPHHIDVNQIARELGGGGHIHAAGAKVRRPLAEVVEQVAALMENAVA